MAPELRKRKAVEPAPAPAPKKTSKVTKAAAKVKQAVKGKAAKVTKKAKPAEVAKPEEEEEVKPAEEAKQAPVANGSAKAAAPPGKGDVIKLDGFGGEITTNDGTETTLKALVYESQAGVVLLTYPKASTPGCKENDERF